MYNKNSVLFKIIKTTKKDVLILKISDYVNIIQNNNITVRDIVERYYTKNITKHNQCACPFHESKRKQCFVIPEDRDKNYWKCFDCGDSGDQVDFLSKYLNVSKSEACKIILNDYKISNFDIEYKKPIVKKQQFLKKDVKLNLTSYILDMFDKSPGYTYFSTIRKISPSIIKKYRLCFGDPSSFIPKEHLPNINFKYYSNIIPIWDKRNVINVICRASTNHGTRYVNLKNIPIYIFNQNKLFAKHIDRLYICESILDALSIETLGGHAIGLNSTSNKKYLIDFINYYKKNISKKEFVLCGDEDNAGLDMNNFLEKEFKKTIHSSLKFEVKEDINKMLINNILEL